MSLWRSAELPIMQICALRVVRMYVRQALDSRARVSLRFVRVMHIVSALLDNPAHKNQEPHYGNCHNKDQVECRVGGGQDRPQNAKRSCKGRTSNCGQVVVKVPHAHQTMLTSL